MPLAAEIPGLVPYEATIVWCWVKVPRDDGGHAWRGWLELRNYAYVFRPFSPDDTAGRAMTGPIRLGDWRQNENRTVQRYHLARLLDAIDVIRFQRAVVKPQLDAGQPGSDSSEGVNHSGLRFLKAGLKGLGIADNALAPIAPDDAFYAMSRRVLDTILKGAIPAPFDRSVYTKMKAHGFGAYFPRPDLIRQEHRSARDDRRDIPYIPSKRGPPKNLALENFLESVDQRLIEEIEADLAELAAGTLSPARTRTVQKMADEIAAKESNGASRREAMGRWLHSGLDRVCAFAYRGDYRDPPGVQKEGGFLPGITRTDEKVMEAELQPSFKEVAIPVEDAAKKLDEALDVYGSRTVLLRHRRKGGIIQSAFRSIFGGKYRWEERDRYFEALRELGMMRLDVYIRKQDFRCFLSTTKSIALGKGFSGDSWLYATRTLGALHVPSHVPEGLKDPGSGNVISESAFYLIKNVIPFHSFVHFFEQELAVLGPVWWEDVVGFRKTRTHLFGQNIDGGDIKNGVFVGPVFLREALVTDEQTAFWRLFEEMSGQSQGERKTVLAVYEKKAPGKEDWSFAYTPAEPSASPASASPASSADASDSTSETA